MADLRSIHTVAGIGFKGVQVLLNLIILIIYRVGYSGGFLGVGGTWDLNSDKTQDVEIIASGIFVGFFIYTSVVLISYCFGALEQNKTIMELIMSFIGMFMFVMVGVTALHYWIGYTPDEKFRDDPEKTFGIILGILCLFEGLVYLADFITSGMQYLKQEFIFDD